MLDKLSTQDTIDFLISTFGEVRKDFKDISFDSRREINTNWFNSILLKMEIFGVNEVNFNRFKLPIIKSTKLKEFVSINNFTILEVNRLYPLTLVAAYQNEEDWSHPFVLHLLKCLCDNRLLSNSLKLKDMFIYTNFKLFMNMVHGILLSGNSPLAVNDQFYASTFNNKLKQLQDKIIQLSGIENTLIGYDVDTFLFECDVTSIRIENIKSLFDVELTILGKKNDIRAYKVLSKLTKKIDIIITK